MPITTVVKITRRSWSCSDQDLKIAISPLTLGRGEISHWSERTGHFHYCHGSRLQISFFLFLFFSLNVGKLLCEADEVCWSTVELETRIIFCVKALRIRRTRNLWFAPMQFYSRSGPKLLCLKQENTINGWMVGRDLMTTRPWMFLLHVEWHYN